MSNIFAVRGKHAFSSSSSGGFASTIRALLILAIVLSLVAGMALSATAKPEQGPPDDDKDGVADDGTDLCLGTAPADKHKVDATGCVPAAVVDADNDGVPDDGTDLCLGTAPADKNKVDATGCVPAAVVDADNDGVPDDGTDLCLGTAPADKHKVDATGCVPEDGGNNGIGEGQGCGFGNQDGTPDADGDGIRDECDANDNDGPDGDLDGDGTKNSADPDDNDVCIPDGSGTPDTDGDGIRDACDDSDDRDVDGDGVTVGEGDPDDNDPCNPTSTGTPDTDGDGIRDLCDPTDDRPPLSQPAIGGSTVIISVTEVTNGARYEHGSVPSTGCASNGFGLPSLTLSAITGPLALYGLGTQTATCTLPGLGSASVTYTIVDSIAPVLDLPADITVTGAGANTQVSGSTLTALQQLAGTVVTFSASASDAVTGPATIDCLPASGSSFSLGTTTVTCSASDLSGNVGEGSFSVTVLGGRPGGVNPPTDDEDEEVLGETIRRGSPAGSGGSGASTVLGRSYVRSGLLPFTGAGTVATFVLIALLLMAVGLGSAVISRHRPNRREPQRTRRSDLDSRVPSAR